MTNLSILLVEPDDDRRNRFALRFKETPHHVICTAGAETALRFLQHEAFNVLVTPTQLDQGEFFELFRAAQLKSGDIRIVAISSEEEHSRPPSWLELAAGFGTCILLNRPFRFEEFLGLIEGEEFAVAV